MTAAGKKAFLAAYYAACILVSAACVLALALRYLLNPALENQRGAIEDQLESLFGDGARVQVRIGGISFSTSIYRNFFHVEDVAVISGATGEELAFADHVYSEISYASLYEYLAKKRTASPLNLVLDGVRIAAVRGEDGGLRVAGLEIGAQHGQGAAWRVPLEWLEVRNAEIAFSDETGEWASARLRDVRLAAKHEPGRRVLLEIEADGNSFRAAKLLLEIEDRAILAPDVPGAQVRFEARFPEKIEAESASFERNVLRAIGTATLGADEIRVDYAAFLSGGRMQAPGMSADAAQASMRGSISVPRAGWTSGTASGTGVVGVARANINAPEIALHPIALEGFDAQFAWRVSPDSWALRVREGLAADGHVQLKFSANVRGAQEGGTVVEASAQMQESVDATRAHRYLPAAAGDEVGIWLETAIGGGTVTGLDLSVRGRPEEFPYASGEDGEFRLGLSFEGTDFSYWPGWPVISGTSGTLAFAGKEMRLELRGGSLQGIGVAQAQATIPDLLVHDELVLVTLAGKAAGDSFLAAVGALPPLADRQLSDRVHLTGAAEISAAITVPIRRAGDIAVTGTVELEEAELALPGQEFIGGNPFEMKGLRGKIDFSHEQAKVTGSGRLLGNRAHIRALLAPDGWEATLQTPAKIGEWLAHADAAAAGDLIRGNAQVRISKSSDEPLALSSDLLGVEIGLPSPLGKSMTDRTPVRLEIAGENVTTIDYAQGLLQLALVREAGRSRVLAGMNQPPPPAEIPGNFVLRGSLHGADLDPWLRLIPGDDGGAAPRPSVNAILEGSQVTLLGRPNARFRAEVSSARDGLASIAIDSEHVAGSVVLSRNEAGETVAVADFTKITVGKEDDEEEEQAEPQNFPQLPRLVLAAQQVRIGKREFGKVAAEGAPNGDNWVLERLVAENAGYRTTITGASAMAGAPSTNVRLGMEITDIRSFMSSFGTNPEAVSEGNATFEGDVSWEGSLLDPDVRTMNGNLTLSAEKARFREVDSGAFRLLRLLSPDTFLGLGFTESFQEGIRFETLGGTFRIDRGVMATDNLQAKSEDLSVVLSGQTNLDTESLDFRGRIRPGVVAVNALLGAAVLATAPAAPLSAAVGWVVGKILKRPIDAFKQPFSDIGSYEYTVTGSWDEPIYTETDS